jgi:hypothetical protein
MGRIGRLRLVVDGIALNVTTWPWQKRDPKTGEQKPVPGMLVDGKKLK